MTEISLSGRGARGESQADILRRTGQFGVLPTDTDAQAVGKLNAAASASAATALDAATDAQAAANLSADYGSMPVYRTWTLLNAATAAANDMATVLTDTGTHTDPVVGGTVSNSGIFSYSTSPAGWQWIANTSAADMRADLASGVIGNAIFATKAFLLASPAVFALGTVVETRGALARNDRGGAKYAIVGAEPSHPGKIGPLAGGRWAEIISTTFDVMAFDCAGDCPNLSVYNVATQQAAIIAAVTGATNDARAIQNALWAAHAIGGATVTYGGGGRRHRVAFSSAGVRALVMGQHTTLKRVGSGWLEWDPSLIDGSYTPPPGGGFPTGRQWPDHGLTCGDPATGMVYAPAVLAGTSNIVPSDVFDSDYTEGGEVIDLDIRCHTRVFWHALADQPLPSYRRLRLYGTYFRCPRKWRLIDSSVKWTPNDGINITGLIDVTLRDSNVERCGYGAVNGTATNGISAIGIVAQNQPELSSRGLLIDNTVTRGNKDEGIAFAGVRGFITNTQSYGDHDRAVEGISGYAFNETAATIGTDVGSNIVVSGVIHEGRDDVGSGTIAAGSNQLQMDDAFYLNSFTETGVRSVFIPGAGAGGGNGPFAITSVDYVTNIVTLGSNATNSVGPVGCYTYGQTSVTVADTNEGRVTIENVRARDIFAIVHPVYAASRNNGRISIRDIELENITVPTNFHAVDAEAVWAEIRNIRVIGSTGGTNSGVARIKADYADINGVKASVGFAYGARATLFSASGQRLNIEGLDVDGVTLSAISMDHTGPLPYIFIHDNRVLGINSAADQAQGFIRFNTNTLRPGEAIVKGNFARFAGKTPAPIAYSGSAFPNGTLGDWTIKDNDFYDPRHLSFAGTAYSFNGAQAMFNTYVDLNNNIPGQRQLQGPTTPTAGRFYAGDEILVAYPAPGAAKAAIVTTGGNPATLYAADGVTSVTVVGAVTASVTVVVSDATNIWPNDTIYFPATSNTRRVVWAVGNTLTLSAAVTVANGAAVQNGVPVTKIHQTLAA